MCTIMCQKHPLFQYMIMTSNPPEVSNLAPPRSRDLGPTSLDRKTKTQRNYVSSCGIDCLCDVNICQYTNLYMYLWGGPPPTKKTKKTDVSMHDPK